MVAAFIFLFKVNLNKYKDFSRESKYNYKSIYPEELFVVYL